MRERLYPLCNIGKQQFVPSQSMRGGLKNSLQDHNKGSRQDQTTSQIASARTIIQASQMKNPRPPLSTAPQPGINTKNSSLKLEPGSRKPKAKTKPAHCGRSFRTTSFSDVNATRRSHQRQDGYRFQWQTRMSVYTDSW